MDSIKLVNDSEERERHESVVRKEGMKEKNEQANIENLKKCYIVISFRSFTEANSLLERYMIISF